MNGHLVTCVLLRSLEHKQGTWQSLLELLCRTFYCKALTPLSSDVNIITPRARTYSNTSNGSSGYYTNHNQYYNTIGHNRHRVASSAGVTLGTPTSAGQSAALLRSSSATDVNNMKTPKPRATLLSAARMAKGSTNSL
ncbi:CLIP-associating protein 1 isoform X4, partial [Biomphalaria glabrata]